MTKPEKYPEPTDFSIAMASINSLYEKGFDRWEFLPGMRFGDRKKWWGTGGLRTLPHEGVDLCLFRDTRGKLHAMQGTIRIPVMYDGIIVKTGSDFLGRSIFFRHECFDAGGRVLHTVFGHTRPCHVFRYEHPVKQGEIIAEIAETGNSNILPHLHITAAWIPASMSSAGLDWETLGRSREILLFDPLTAVKG